MQTKPPRILRARTTAYFPLEVYSSIDPLDFKGGRLSVSTDPDEGDWMLTPRNLHRPMLEDIEGIRKSGRRMTLIRWGMESGLCEWNDPAFPATLKRIRATETLTARFPELAGVPDGKEAEYLLFRFWAEAYSRDRCGWVVPGADGELRGEIFMDRLDEWEVTPPAPAPRRS